MSAQVSELNVDRVQLDKNYIKNCKGIISKNELKTSEAKVKIDETPFKSDGNEVDCFHGEIIVNNPKTNRSESKRKVFKLAKHANLNLEYNFAAQTISRFLAKKFSKIK